MENFHLFELNNFPELQLYGNTKFKTPRCLDDKVPILVLPEGVTNGLITFGNKNYLQVVFDADVACEFETINTWLSKQNDENNKKLIHPILNQIEDKFQMKIRLPETFSVINFDGSETSNFHSTIGAAMRCAVEMPCLWENNESIGLSFQMIQCKITKPPKCLISQLVEEPDYIPY
tara:strand:- start:809 stop:1336 length:528 start_codon:yes stop_codon:yes gene_type:complete